MNITGGKYNSLFIKTADFANIKPTLSKIRQAVFNSLSTQGDYSSFCDLFSGSGIMTFEAISRGYDVVSVEIDRQTANIIKENAKKLNISINLQNMNAIKFLQNTNMKFDIFYIDPPYQSGLYEVVLTEIFNRDLLNINGIIVLEKPSKLQIITSDFEIIKEKKYADKTILYLKNFEK